MITTSVPDKGIEKRPSGVWDYISASRLNLWLKCPLAFKLRYVDGIRSPTSPAMFVGKATHQALETWYRHRQLNLAITAEAVVAGVATEWDAAVVEQGVRFNTAADEQVCRHQATDLVRVYLNQISPDESRPLAVETSVEAPLVDPITGEDLGVPMLGVMDLVLAEPAGARIVDFKTAARGGDPGELTHELQLTTYSYLFRHAAQQIESGLEIRSLVKTKTPKVETHRYAVREEQHFRRLFQVVRAYLDDLDCGRFVFRPSLTCGSCEFLKSHCHDWCG